ncbi:hypothetical protein VTK56DRAFT_1517 [Thermocarpiscus australiensis]
MCALLFDPALSTSAGFVSDPRRRRPRTAEPPELQNEVWRVGQHKSRPGRFRFSLSPDDGSRASDASSDCFNCLLENEHGTGIRRDEVPDLCRRHWDANGKFSRPVKHRCGFCSVTKQFVHA